jgi:hypothetical protein
MIPLLFNTAPVLGQPTARYLLTAEGMPFIGELPFVAPDQVQTIALDFGRFLPAGVMLTGLPELNVSVKSGTDSSPASRISAGPTIGTAAQAIGGTGRAQTAVLFQVAGCVAGATYIVEAVCPRSDGDTAEGYVYLHCVQPN